MKVAKKFNRIWYRGRITSIDFDGEGNKLYHIEYNDGDREDMDYKECIEALSARPEADEDKDYEDYEDYEDDEDEDE